MLPGYTDLRVWLRTRIDYHVLTGKFHVSAMGIDIGGADSFLAADLLLIQWFRQMVALASGEPIPKGEAPYTLEEMQQRRARERRRNQQRWAKRQEEARHVEQDRTYRMFSAINEGVDLAPTLAPEVIDQAVDDLFPPD